jgi:hypothetical protein
MKLFKSLLLASATGLVAVSGASAADLGAKKPSPVEYVKACYNPLWGTAGGFVIPGSNTCLRISGRVRADYVYGETFTNATAAGVGLGRSADTFGWRTRAIINMDAVTQTEIGPVRSFFSLFFQGDRGSIAGGNGATFAGNNMGSNLSVDKAFVQFAGITAGRAQSFFDFSGNFAPSYNFSVGLGSENGTTNMLAYTLPLGSTGASFTVSLEDPSTRRVASTTAVLAAGNANYIYGGQRMPDVVGSLDLNQAWGSFKLSGAVHQLRAVNYNAVGNFAGTQYGYAVQAAVKVNLPMIAAGDYLWLQAAYAEGALSYLGGFNTPGNLAVGVADAFVNGLGGTSKSKGFSIDGGFVHFWTPTVRQWVVGTYRRVEVANTVTPLALVAGRNAAVDLTNWRVGTGLQWNLAPGLFVGVEGNYLYADPKGLAASRHFLGGARTASGSAGAWEGRLRIQRDF